MKKGILIADLNCEDSRVIDSYINSVCADFQLMMVRQEKVWKEIKPIEFRELVFALISIDYPDGLKLAEQIYSLNPFCHIVLFGNGRPDVIPFLGSRPIHYVDVSKDKYAHFAYLKDGFQRLKKESYYFHYEDKGRTDHIPYSRILYFTIRDRRAYCQTIHGEEGPFRRKLDELEEETAETDSFLRCHQSFLVNKSACAALNKSDQKIRLINGEIIDVSRPYWQSVKEFFADLSD